MRKTKEILRLHWQLGVGVRQIGRSLSISHATVIDTLRRAQAAGLSWPLPEDLGEAELEARLYPGNKQYTGGRSEPDWRQVHEELRDSKVTLRLLWTGYKREHPDGYQYSAFCRRYRKWRGKLDPVLRQTYRPGEKLFLDYAGGKVADGPGRRPGNQQPFLRRAVGPTRGSGVDLAAGPASGQAS